MLKRLITAIARIITHTTQPTVGIPVPPTQPAGPVNKEPTQPAGNKRSAQGSTKPRKSSPAQPRSPKKQKAAKRTSAASKSTSKKPSVARTVKSPSSRGNSTQTPVRQTRQPAAPAAKRKRSVAKQDTQAPSRK